MALLEDRTAVFIVRVWCERGDGDSALTEWRGSVEHVPTGQRAFFRDLEAVLDFMTPHLETVGIDARQRFWERIASAIDEGDAACASFEVPLPIPSPTHAPRRSRTRARAARNTP